MDNVLQVLAPDTLTVIEEVHHVLNIGEQGPAGGAGPVGPQGSPGLGGDTGPAGPGVPTGGAVGQVLQKSSDTDFDTIWVTPAPGGVTSFNTRTGDITLSTADVTGALGYSDIARTGVANTFTTGQTIQTGADANKGLVVRANSASQSGNLLECQNSAGTTVLIAIGPDGSPRLGLQGNLFFSRGGRGIIFTANPLTDTSPGTFLQGTATGGMTAQVNGDGFYVVHNDSGSGKAPIDIRPFYTGQSTSTPFTALRIHAVPNGTAGIGFGDRIEFNAQSTTTASQQVAVQDAVWADPVHATRRGRLVFSVYDTVNVRECLRLESVSGAAAVGFLGAAAQVRQAVTGSRGGNLALASLLTALANLGLITDSSTV